MIGPRFIDTNVLLYSVSCAPEEARKRDIAIALLEADDIVLSIQVLQEFYVQATRVTRPDPLADDIAVGLVRAIVSLARSAVHAAVLFVAAAAVCGAGLLVAPATAIFAAALCFGGGLVALASAHR